MIGWVGLKRTIIKCEECGKIIKKDRKFLIVEIMIDAVHVADLNFSPAFCSWRCLGRWAKKKRKEKV